MPEESDDFYVTIMNISYPSNILSSPAYGLLLYQPLRSLPGHLNDKGTATPIAHIDLVFNLHFWRIWR